MQPDLFGFYVIFETPTIHEVTISCRTCVTPPFFPQIYFLINLQVSAKFADVGLSSDPAPHGT